MKDETIKTKDLFCAKEQEVTPHKVAVDMNGDFLFACESEGCDRFVKFPGDLSPDELEQRMADHHENNAGQVSLEDQSKKLENL
jgi:hypothetical protein